MTRLKKEKVVELYLEKEMRKLGGRALKLSCAGLSGFPDRTLLLPNAYVAFAECKQEGKNLRKLQVWVRDKLLRPLGFRFYTVRTKTDVQDIILDYKRSHL